MISPRDEDLRIESDLFSKDGQWRSFSTAGNAVLAERRIVTSPDGFNRSSHLEYCVWMIAPDATANANQSHRLS